MGLDGLADGDEFSFSSYQRYVDAVRSKLNNEGFERFNSQLYSPLNDPAGDNFHHFLGGDYNDKEMSILDRYKYYNGLEGNSSSSSSNYSSSTTYPDVEDLNGDHTLNEKEQYFEYVVDIDKNVFENESQWASHHIASRVETNVSLKNGERETIKWYQFKIPIDDYDRTEGSISNFQSIRFIRMYMTGFSSETYLRFGALDLVRTDWSVYSQNKNLFEGVAGNNGGHNGQGRLEVSSVNIENDADKLPVNYMLPPGISRVEDPSQTQVRQENEQSMLLAVDSLGSKQARAVYKKISLDARQYKRLRMFVHAENRINEEPVGDNHLFLFLRMGADLTENYYEYQIPLVITPDGSTDRNRVWPQENAIDFAFSTMTKLKLRRDRMKTAGEVHVNERYSEMDGNNIITVIGNPSFGEVAAMMIGIRNEDSRMHSADVWVNELRMVGFSEDGGQAGLINAGLVLSDLGSLSVGGRIESAGFGNIEDNVEDRRTDDYYEYNIAAAVQLGKLFPEKAKVNLPFSYSFSKSVSKPKYDPLNSDLELDETLENQTTKHARDSIKDLSMTTTTYKSYSVNNVRVGIVSEKPMPYDPGNFSFSLGYNETKDKSPDVQYDITRNYDGTFNYNYSLNPKPVEPLKKVKFLNNKYGRLLHDFNFYYLPNSLTFSTQMHRYYNEVQMRDFTVEMARDTSFPYLSWDKDFTWTRTSDVKWNLTRNLKLSFNTAMNASIDEIIRDEDGYYRDVPINKSYLDEVGMTDWYDRWKDTVWSSIHHFGTPVEYYQRLSASWSIPVNKLPYLDWVTANTQYSADYTWNRGAETILGSGLSETGNMAVSRRQWNGDVRFNLEKLYNQVDYLKNINKRFGNNVRRTNQKKKTEKSEPKAPRTYERKNIRMRKDKETRISHRLGTKNLKVTITDKDSNEVRVKYKIVDQNVIVFNSKEDLSRLNLKIVGTYKERTVWNEVADVTARVLMSIRNVSASYREIDGLSLNGYIPESGLLGQDHKAPGYDFTFGFYKADNFLKKAVDHEWMLNDSSIVTRPVIKTKEQDLQLKSSVVPFPGIKIDLNAAWMKTRSEDIYYMFDNANTFSGSYSKTHVAIKTAFKGKKLNSPLFNEFMENRHEIRNKVVEDFVKKTGITDQQQIDDKLLLNSSDVLVPAFFAAYSGRDAKKSKLDLLPDVFTILPNWRVSVDLLSRLSVLQPHLKSLNLKHAYKCTYNVNSYYSIADWSEIAGGYGEVAGTSIELDNGYYASEYAVDNVNINESFSPLIGVDATLNNSLMLKAEVKKSRTDGLDVAALQVVESYSDEYVFGAGYRIDDFGAIVHLANGKSKTVKNDLNLRLDLSYKNTDAYIRKIEDVYSQLSSGLTSFIIKFSADYVVSSRLNVRFFYDRTASTPKVSSSYPIINSDFGIGLKLLLSK